MKVKARELAFSKEEFDKVFGYARFLFRNYQSVSSEEQAVMDLDARFGNLTMLEALNTEKGGKKVEALLHNRFDGDWD